MYELNGEAMPMNENRYRSAGWAAIVLAIALLVSVGGGAMFMLVGMRGHHPLAMLGFGLPILAVNLILFGLFAFVLLRLRKLLRERFDFRRADGLITAVIVLSLLYVTLGLGLGGGAATLLGARGSTVIAMDGGPSMPPPPLIGRGMPIWTFMGMSMVNLAFSLVTGVVFIMLGLRLRAAQETPSAPLRYFSLLTLIMGVMAVTVVAGPIAAVMVPLWLGLLALLFFRSEEIAPDFV